MERKSAHMLPLSQDGDAPIRFESQHVARRPHVGETQPTLRVEAGSLESPETFNQKLPPQIGHIEIIAQMLIYGPPNEGL